MLNTRLAELRGVGVIAHADGYRLTRRDRSLRTALDPLLTWAKRWTAEGSVGRATAAAPAPPTWSHTGAPNGSIQRLAPKACQLSRAYLSSSRSPKRRFHLLMRAETIAVRRVARCLFLFLFASRDGVKGGDHAESSR